MVQTRELFAAVFPCVISVPVRVWSDQRFGRQFLPYLCRSENIPAFGAWILALHSTSYKSATDIASSVFVSFMRWRGPTIEKAFLALRAKNFWGNAVHFVIEGGESWSKIKWILYKHQECSDEHLPALLYLTFLTWGSQSKLCSTA